MAPVGTSESGVHGELLDVALGGGDRIAVWVHRGVAEHRRHPLDQRVGDGMLQPLGLVVDRVPGVAQERDEIGLDQPVPPDHPERGAAPFRR